MPFRCLFHVHTRRSFDSLLSPKTIYSRAREMGLDVLIVTDHNTVQGSLDLGRFANGISPMTITAAEYQSEKGDIIGLFLREEIRTRRSSEIIQQIRAQGGLVVLPHPFKGHKLDDELLRGVDLLETYNSRCSQTDNAKAAELCLQRNLPFLAGADAHTSSELGTAINEFTAEVPASEAQFREQLLDAPRRFLTQPASPLCQPYSQMIKAAKTRDARLFFYQAKRLALVLARGEKS
jgi:predicted metal-dependent phosphoesterase TrpH